MKTALKVFLLTFAFCGQAMALDFYSLIDSSCKIHNGLIVGVNPTDVEMLTLNGDYEKLARATINNIIIFSSIQNPIASFKMSSELILHAKQIDTTNSDKPEFMGWPIRFVEDLVIFYDFSGKIHVHELTDVTSIRDVESKDVKQTYVLDHKPVTLNFTDVNSRCLEGRPSKEGIGPTRIMSDKISISDFLESFEKGFQDVESYQERTKFYASPFLYERRSKLGLGVFNQYQENDPILPVYFQWSTGKPYRFQSFTVFGSAPSHYIAISEPITAIQSDLKSHFFHATFVGNLPALPAGTAYYLAGTQSSFPKSVQAINNFNYLAMMGADYGPYSFSFGTYFPIFGYQVKLNNNTDAREVLATSFSPAFEVMYSKGKIKLRAITSWSSASGSGSDNTKLLYNSSSGQTPANFTVTGGYARGGIDFKISDELRFSVDEVFTLSNYTESVGTGQNYFNATGYNTSAVIEQSFGYYISVKGFVNYFNRKYSYSFPTDSESVTNQDYSFGGALEFVF